LNRLVSDLLDTCFSTMVGDDEILGHLGGLCDVRLLGFVSWSFFGDILVSIVSFFLKPGIGS
jgi:hypothetical protein